MHGPWSALQAWLVDLSLAVSLEAVRYLTAANAAMVLLTLFLSGNGPWTSIFWYTLSANSALPDLACRFSRELYAIRQPLQSHQALLNSAHYTKQGGTLAYALYRDNTIAESQ